MARFDAIPPYTGTIGPVCIYQMYGRYFMRSRSSLTGERVKKDPAFKKTMQYAALLSRASSIGSAVYAAIPAHKKQHAIYRKLTGEAMTWLKYQWKEKDIIEYLLKQYTGQAVKTLTEPRATRLRDSFAHKTPRVRPYSRGGKRQLRQSLKEAARVVKLHYSLDAYRNRDRTFRKEYNKELIEYPWTAHVMTG